ncbi:MAG: hypothetical protein M1830_003279, partial [Pleopsidium flavum]
MGSIETTSSRHIPTLLGNIASNGNALSQGDTNARTDLLVAARELCLALETPVEAVLRIAWAE